MEDIILLEVVQGIGRLHNNKQGQFIIYAHDLAGFFLGLVNQILDRVAFSIFHYQIMHPVYAGRRRNIVAPDDVGVVKLNQELRLSLETLKQVGINDCLGENHLDGHNAVGLDFQRLEDDAHAAGA